ncbi:trypsin-like peptidase domain-containing protein [Streptomyces sp. NPDC101150]|uniref:trypsin-like peptidase domain-containing protein n=1 Tax=Streptomyces sp. NPDC101150 TaxID=3366114 RepID=UPI0038259D79
MPIDPSEVQNVFAARLRQELRAVEDRSDTVSDARRAYREAACLLSRFDPRLLRLPGEAAATGAAALELLDDCTATSMQGTVVWSLRSDIRHAVLRALPGPEAARGALETNRDQFCADSGPEHLCLDYLSGRPPPDRDRTPEELADTLQAVRWLSLVPGTHGLPDTGEVQHALERARLLQPLERFVRGPFEGRPAELAAIRSYVLDAHPPPVPPLVIHGPGGMGKSTLLAAFLLRSIRCDRPGFPFAYIDFERPTLSIQEPVTLIGEAARQLGVQYPAHRAEFNALAQECRQAAGSQREEEDRVTQLYGLATTRAVLGRSSSHEFQTLATGRESDLLARVADVLRRAVAGSDQEDQPFVLVIDSYEDAQYRGSPVLGRLWATCRAFESVYPRMRWVVAGRAPVDHPARDVTPLEIELRELEPAAAVALLQDCGVTDPGVATVLAERVGGHPLSLKLAARAVALARSDGTDLAGDLLQSLPARRGEDFRRVDQLLVQGILYDHILSHIADENVRRLARPGLALRTITPEIIRDVLAEPCGLPVPTQEAARALFDEFCRLDMVEPTGPDAVRYRADVRAIMLRLPDGDHAAVLHEVERRAVDYYAARDGVADRAEEIYHRLRLDEDPREVEKRWQPGVERFLLGAQQDLPPRAAALLTARLGAGASDKVTEAADQADWERITAREVADLLAQGFAREAHERIRRRCPWAPCSPLHPLFAETLCLLGRRDDARRAVADALAGIRDADCAARRLELLLLSARLAENAGDLAGADRALREAEDTAVSLGQDLEAMGALLARTRLAAAAEHQETEAGGQLAEKLRQMPDAVLADQPVLVRAVASQIYERDPGALDHALKVAGLPADDATLETLGGAMRRATTRRSELLGPVMNILNDAIGTYRRPGEEQHGIADLLRLARDRGNLGQLARRLLTVTDPSGEINAGVAAAMRVGTGGRPTCDDPPARTGGRTISVSLQVATAKGVGTTGRTTQGTTAGPPAGTDSPPETEREGSLVTIYLPPEQIRQVLDATLETGLAEPALRPLLFDGIMLKYQGFLPRQTAPGPQVQSDLNSMNKVERLVDGSVPLEIWLRNAAAQTVEAAPLAVFQRALDDVARQAGGEPDVLAGVGAPETKEEIVHRDDTVPIGFLRGGDVAATAVARLKVLPFEGGAPLQPNGFPHSGTGWLVAPTLLITNHHVINARTGTGEGRPAAGPDDLNLQAQHAHARFDYDTDTDGTETEEAAITELVAADPQLDYAVLRLAAEPARPVLKLAQKSLTVADGDYVAVNIIQHPGGLSKRVALRNNLVFETDANDVRYFTDTRGGSSGSPVLTDDWKVVALHRGTRRVENVMFQGKTTAFVNVGTQMDVVMRHLEATHPDIHAEIATAQQS